MADIKWVGNHIEVEPPKNPKKITGTRFAAIMGANRWNTPFKTWCEIAKVYQEPFTETIYTKAGKTIEPKQADFLKKAYYMENIVSPTDVYGEDYFQKTRGDFFHDFKHLGGMWDYLEVDENMVPTAVFEMKTTKRAEDWAKDVPEYYAQQAALYAYLLGVDQVYMVCSFLKESDYENPDAYVPTLENTMVRPFLVSERYPNFKQMVRDAENWWYDHIDKGISPDFDPKADADVLEELKKNHLNPDTDMDKLFKEAEYLKGEVDHYEAEMKQYSDRLKKVNEQIRKYLMENLREGDKKAEVPGKYYVFTLTRSSSTKIDEAKLKADNLYEKYTKEEPSYRYTVTKKKEDK